MSTNEINHLFLCVTERASIKSQINSPLQPETWREMTQRTSSALMKILSCDAKTTIVVGHGNSGQALNQARLELPLELEVSFQFDVASVTELRVNQWGEREIARLNSIYDA